MPASFIPLLLTAPALAHGPLDEVLAIHLEASRARVSLVAPAEAFSSADADGDGLLSVDEVRGSRAAILATLDAGLSLTDATRTFGDVLVPGDTDSADHLQLMLQYRWESPPETVRVRYGLFDAAGTPLPVIVTDTEAGVRRQGELTPDSPEARIRGESPAQADDAPDEAAPDEALWLAGARHVAEGPDHILFIIALVLAAPRLRQLIGPISAFTLAHSSALAAVAFGLNPGLPGWLIEAGIAASVAGLAVLDLTGKKARRLWVVTGLCGLVHGLGFAGALSDSLGGLSGWASALVELTVGVEVAQLAVALGALVLLAGLSRLPHYPRLRILLASLIIAIGSAWTIERLAIPLIGS